MVLPTSCLEKNQVLNYDIREATLILWSSFLAGKNLGTYILSKFSIPKLWDFTIPLAETFLSKFEKALAIDFPGLNYMKTHHQKEREVLRGFLNKEVSIEEYDKIAFENHKLVKTKLFDSLKENYDLLACYFGLADVIGHLSFGLGSKMKIVYAELNEIVRKVKETIDGSVFGISDHGMTPIGRFGDHSIYDFWSLNVDQQLNNPKITDFRSVIEKKLKTNSTNTT